MEISPFLSNVINEVRPEGLPSSEEEMLNMSYEEKEKLYKHHLEIISKFRQKSLLSTKALQEKLHEITERSKIIKVVPAPVSKSTEHFQLSLNESQASLDTIAMHQKNIQKPLIIHTPSQPPERASKRRKEKQIDLASTRRNPHYANLQQRPRFKYQ